MHCAGELDTDNRGVGASKVDAGAQDGVGGSTPELDDVAQNAVDPGASELNATTGVTIQARSTRE